MRFYWYVQTLHIGQNRIDFAIFFTYTKKAAPVSERQPLSIVMETKSNHYERNLLIQDTKYFIGNIFNDSVIISRFHLSNAKVNSTRFDVKLFG